MNEWEILDFLGRYEYTDERSNKYWEIRAVDHSQPLYVASWGRIGAAPQETEYLGTDTVYKKIREKIAKGYVKVGSASEHPRPKDPIKKGPKDPIKKDEPVLNFMQQLRQI